MDNAEININENSVDKSFNIDELPILALIMQVTSCEFECSSPYTQIDVEGCALDGMGNQISVGLTFGASHNEAMEYIETYAPGSLHKVDGLFLLDGSVSYLAPQTSQVPPENEDAIRAAFAAGARRLAEKPSNKKSIMTTFYDSAFKFAEVAIGKTLARMDFEREKKYLDGIFTGRLCFASGIASGKNRAEKATADALSLIQPFVGTFGTVKCVLVHVACPEKMALEEPVTVSQQLQAILPDNAEVYVSVVRKSSSSDFEVSLMVGF
jgi:hypothetical protein